MAFGRGCRRVGNADVRRRNPEVASDARHQPGETAYANIGCADQAIFYSYYALGIAAYEVFEAAVRQR